MIVYLLYMISPLIVEVIYRLMFPQARFDNEKTRHRYISLCGFVMFLMIGLRSFQNGSGDSRTYYELWKLAQDIPIGILLQIDMEKGFLLCVWVLSRIFTAPQWIFIFSGMLFAIAISDFVEKNCDDICIAFVVFNCLGLFNFTVQGMRQAIAMSICLFAIEFCKKRKLIPFLGGIIMAMLFHASAVVFLVVYPIWGMKVNIKNLLLTVVATVLAFSLVDKVFPIINFLLNDGYSVGDTELTAGGGFTLAIYIVCILAGIWLAAQSEKNNGLSSKISSFSYLTIVSAVCFVMRYNVIGIAERVAFFFAYGEMVLLSYSPQIVIRSQRRFVRLCIILLCFLVSVYKASYSVLIPYRFFWM